VFRMHNNSVRHGGVSDIQEREFVIQTNKKSLSYLAYFKQKYCVFSCGHFELFRGLYIYIYAAHTFKAHIHADGERLGNFILYQSS